MAGSYETNLVLLSIIVAMMASYSALDLAGRVTYSQGGTARLWLLGGAMAMGAGIWSMHFIGMLAFSLPIRLAYDLVITTASLVIAIVVSYFALYVVSRNNLAVRWLLMGGVFMGLGICAMHYTGMAAMRMSPPIRYDPMLFTASVFIAIGASIVALYLAFTLRERSSGSGILYRVLSAMVMGFAIAGMHYTGMAAANYEAGSLCLATTALNLNNETLAYGIALAVISLLTITLVGSIFDARMASQTARMLREVEAANRDLQREVEERTRIQAALKRQAMELERSNKELERFAYVASHDLQAPLRGISGFAQLLNERYGEKGLDQDAREYVQFIVQGTQDMHRLIQALLEFARAGREGANRRPTDFGQAVAMARHNLKALIDERGAQIECGALPTLNIDVEQMTLVLQNLIENAIKFQPGDMPEVRIQAKQVEGAWVISVADRGIGIDPMHQPHVFQIFKRLHRNEDYPGSGIGLSICDKLVRIHGGRIWVESTPGEGATFSFSIPDGPA